MVMHEHCLQWPIDAHSLIFITIHDTSDIKLYDSLLTGLVTTQNEILSLQKCLSWTPSCYRSEFPHPGCIRTHTFGLPVFIVDPSNIVQNCITQLGKVCWLGRLGGISYQKYRSFNKYKIYLKIKYLLQYTILLILSSEARCAVVQHTLPQKTIAASQV